MFPRVTHVRHLKDYELEVTFSDGTVAAMDFGRRIVGRSGVFAPLRREIRFQVRLSPAELALLERAAEGRTSTWARNVLLAAARGRERVGEPGNRTQPG
jgi:hypothetical protein